MEETTNTTPTQSPFQVTLSIHSDALTAYVKQVAEDFVNDTAASVDEERLSNLIEDEVEKQLDIWSRNFDIDDHLDIYDYSDSIGEMAAERFDIYDYEDDIRSIVNDGSSSEVSVLTERIERLEEALTSLAKTLIEVLGN